jgi:hypothetical protein
MNQAEKHSALMTRYGYQAWEIAFLDVVAAHSGYFVPDQFLEFAGLEKIDLLERFTERLVGLRHGSFHTYRQQLKVYKVSSDYLCQALGWREWRMSRKRELEFIRTRLVTLDFVLANPSRQFLAREAEKIAFLTERFLIPLESLPKVISISSVKAKRTVHYFVDHFPVYWSETEGSGQGLLTFIFIDPDQPTLQQFLTYLSSYASLFSLLPRFELVYVAPTSRLFRDAEMAFRKIILSREYAVETADLLRYFRIRRAWERNQRVLAADVLFLKAAQRRLAGKAFETLFEEWACGAISEGQLPAVLKQRFSPPAAIFRTAIFGKSLSAFSSVESGDLEETADPPEGPAEASKNFNPKNEPCSRDL